MTSKKLKYNAYYKFFLQMTFLLAASISLFALAQNDAAFNVHKKSNATFTIFQDTVKASFPGGEKAWTKYIAKKVNKRIDELQASQDTGTALIQFVVDEKGVLSEFEVLKKQNSVLADIVLNALKDGPDWVPATVDGKVIRSVRKQPVTFNISNR